MQPYRMRTAMAAVLLTVGVSGCEQPTRANQTKSLGGTSWKVDKAAGQDIPARVAVTIAFDADGRIAGSAGCNRYFSTYKAAGKTLEIGMVGSTKMMCPPEQMQVEDRFFRALGSVEGWRSEGGNLVLTTGSGDTVIRLTPVKK